MKIHQTVIGFLTFPTTGQCGILLKRLRQGLWLGNAPARWSLIALLFILLVCLAAPILTPYSPNEINVRARYQAPGVAHWLGTDSVGRDSATRLIYGTRVSLAVGFSGVFISGCIGLVLGAISGFTGGSLDRLLVKASEMFMAFPNLVLIMTIVAYVGPSLSNLILIFGFVEWPLLYRLVRAKFLSLREEEFVEALRALSISNLSIMFRHLLSNCAGPITVWATVTLATIIIGEAGLSFLGLGIQSPTPSLGNLLASAQDIHVMREYVWLWLAPGLTIAVLSVCVNFIGEGLRDAFDPRSQV